MNNVVINDHYGVIETPHGQMIFNAHERGLVTELVLHGSWAEEEIAALMPYVKGNVIDIGAHIGTHSLAFARQADYVYAFEPQRMSHHNLCANLLINNIHNVCTMELALGSTCGRIPMWVPDPRHPHTASRLRVGEGDGWVPIAALDSLTLPEISFIKIDVEGHELEVLRGGRDLLNRDHPVVYVEVHYPELRGTILHYMRERGYVGRELFKMVVVDTEYQLWGYLFEEAGK